MIMAQNLMIEQNYKILAIAVKFFLLTKQNENKCAYSKYMLTFFSVGVSVQFKTNGFFFLV